MSTVVQIYKNFTDDWQWKDYLKIADKVTLLTLNVSCQWIFTDLTIRLLSLMTSSISSMSYNWNLNLLKESEKDAMPLWYTLFILIHSYEKMTKTSTKTRNQNRGVGRIQLHAFTSVRVNEYLESTCCAGSDWDLYYWVSAVFSSSLDHACCIKVY
jgi:hypothetical protein